jgi:hypothetical protein
MTVRKTYEKPTLVKRDALPVSTASVETGDPS